MRDRITLLACVLIADLIWLAYYAAP